MDIESLKQKEKVSFIFQMNRDDYDRMSAVQDYLGYKSRKALMVALIRECESECIKNGMKCNAKRKEAVC